MILFVCIFVLLYFGETLIRWSWCSWSFPLWTPRGSAWNGFIKTKTILLAHTIREKNITAQNACQDQRAQNASSLISQLWLQLWRREMPHLVPSIPVPDSLQPPKGIPRLLTWKLGIHVVFFVSTKVLDVIVVQLDVFKYWNKRVLTSQQLDQTVPTWKDIMIQWYNGKYYTAATLATSGHFWVLTIVATMH